MKMRPFGRLIPPEVARRRLLAAAPRVVGTEPLPLDRALGRVAARTVRAPFPVPSFTRATWDGYALRARGTRGASARAPVRFEVVGEVFAEEGFGRPLGDGQAVAIATGGALPPGSDAVVAFEEAEVSGRTLVLSSPVRAGDRTAAPGEDFPKGATLARAGEPLSAASLGALASTGATSVEVFARPRVTIIPNGNELLAPGSPPVRGKIFESNNVTLAAVVRAAGGAPSAVAPVPDDASEIERTIERALPTSEVVLVTGGSSVGEHDFLPFVFPRVGRLLFHGISVRPGKPTLAARAEKSLLVGMPGHPTSCLSNGYWLLLPLLRRVARLNGPGWTDARATLAVPYDLPSSGFSTVVPLRVEAGRAWPTFHDSSAITSLSGANAFALVPPGRTPLRKGLGLTVHLLPSVLAPARG